MRIDGKILRIIKLIKQQPSKMNYFKSIVKNVYDKVLEDDFLEPITEQQMYRILAMSSRRSSTHKSDIRKLSIGQPQKDLFEKVQMISHVSPDREFRILGADPRYQIILGRIKQLNEDLEQVTDIMMQNFPKYQKKLTYSISQIDNLKSLYTARKSSMELKDKLKKLGQANKKSKRITQLNIKLKNLKATLKIVKEIPNIHKMSLIQLKSIPINSLKSRQSLSKLSSLAGIQNFIDIIVSNQLANVIKILQQCLVQKFQEELYENVLKNFLVTQHQSIKYEKMLIKLVQKEIRKINDERVQIKCMCNNYIKLMINLHGVFRWHRQHQEEEAWKPISEATSQNSISINIQNVTRNLSEVMDESFKDIVLEKIYHYEGPQLLQLLYYLIRMSKIVENFSGKNLGNSIMAACNFLGRKLQKLREKAKNQLKQTIELQKMNQWNRLPVANDYSHEPIDKILFQISRHKKSSDFKKINKIKRIAGKILLTQTEKENKNQGDDEQERKRRRTTSANFSPQELQKYIKLGNQQYQEEQEQDEQVLQIEQVTFPFIEKYDKFKQQVKLKLKKPENYQSEVVICQSSLTIVKYFGRLIEYGFYYPIAPCSNMVPDIIFYLFHLYVYSVFDCFISQNLKQVVFTPYEQLQKVDAKYLKKRIHALYPQIYKFLHIFKKENNLMSRQGHSNGSEVTNNSKQNEKGIRSRIVGLESINFITHYIEHIFSVCGWDNNPIWQQKIEHSKSLYNSLFGFIQIDYVPKTCNLKITTSTIENIKWNEDEEVLKQFCNMFLKNFHEYFYQMKAQNKGEVPLHISERLMGVFWKTQLSSIIKTFLFCYKPSNTTKSKNRLEKFMDCLYSGMTYLLKNQSYITQYYEKVKSIFPILFESNWEVAFQMFKAATYKFQFVYAIQIKLLECSESCCHLSGQEFENRRKIGAEWVNSEILAKLKGHGEF